MTANLYKFSGEISEVKPQRGKQFTLEELQGMVGGYIEVISTPDNRLMIMNEEGKLKGLPYNSKATELVKPFLSPGSYIVGDVIVCQKSYLK